MEDLNFTECGDGILFGKYVDSVNCGVIQFLEGKKRDAAKTKRSNIVSQLNLSSLFKIIILIKFVVSVLLEIVYAPW